MDQKAFDKVVTEFITQATSTDRAGNIPGICNALRSKMGSVDSGVSTEAAEKAMSEALAGTLKKPPKATPATTPAPKSPVESTPEAPEPSPGREFRDDDPNPTW